MTNLIGLFTCTDAFGPHNDLSGRSCCPSQFVDEKPEGERLVAPPDHRAAQMMALGYEPKPFSFRDSALFVLFCFFFLLFFQFFLFRAALVAYGASQARGQIRAAATGLHHSHSNTGSKLHLQPTPQRTATPDPQPTE